MHSIPERTNSGLGNLHPHTDPSQPQSADPNHVANGQANFHATHHRHLYSLESPTASSSSPNSAVGSSSSSSSSSNSSSQHLHQTHPHLSATLAVAAAAAAASAASSTNSSNNGGPRIRAENGSLNASGSFFTNHFSDHKGQFRRCLPLVPANNQFVVCCSRRDSGKYRNGSGDGGRPVVPPLERITDEAEKGPKAEAHGVTECECESLLVGGQTKEQRGIHHVSVGIPAEAAAG